MKESLKKKTDKRKLAFSVIVLLLAALLTAGLVYAWFVTKMDMATLIEVKAPSDISILGPGGSEMASLDLNYTDSDKDENGKVTIRRVICVQSASEYHKLEIVHTTNMKGLTFKLYKASEVTAGTPENSVTDSGHTYSYDSTPIAGKYINPDTTGSSDYYKYADASKHSYNYGTYNQVQKHAEPIYWLAEDDLQATTGNKIEVAGTECYRTYYVCEVTWTETEKETDIFYILAKNVNKNS